MNHRTLTGAQKTRLRGLGQKLAVSLKLGKGGLTPALVEAVREQLRTRELVKLRFYGADREERAALCLRIASEGGCECVGAAGHTALFFRPHPEPALRRLTADIGQNEVH
jgi:RNA-binding protein